MSATVKYMTYYKAEFISEMILCSTEKMERDKPLLLYLIHTILLPGYSVMTVNDLENLQYDEISSIRLMWSTSCCMKGGGGGSEVRLHVLERSRSFNPPAE